MPRFGLRSSTFLVASAALLAFSSPSFAAARHHHHYRADVSYSDGGHHGAGGQALVSDGPGTGFGFHRLPAPYRIGALIHRDRQAAAVRSAVFDDAVSQGNGPYGVGLPGDSVYGYGNGATYGVFSGADGYGSPYFAGWYGPGNGADLGPLGHAYTN